MGEKRIYTATISACCDCPNVLRFGPQPYGPMWYSCTVETGHEEMTGREAWTGVPDWCPLPKAPQEEEKLAPQEEEK